ncbi:MAG: hypothetical protein K0R57_6232 [Paenibacillaceae bacterium]|nr:hypothetical protein [Paenibacillaceae bacterium]
MSHHKIHILFKHECRDFLKQPPLWILVLLPVLMSKMIIAVMGEGEQDMMLLPSWVLFAQVMVGIMIIAPDLMEERERKTLDSLMLSPLSLGQVVFGKGAAVLVFSLFSQLAVFVVNEGVESRLAPSLIVMLLGGTLFVLVGVVIGLVMNSVKNTTALSSAVMIVLFLTGTLYPALPDWRTALMWLPGVIVVESLQSVLEQSILWLQIVFLTGWLLAAAVAVGYLVRKEERR